ncbi:hypothetical protein D1007_20971 [Hordeum vulgare]|nr:hypothetical protein D1007_20971 [Hordeum vulgare]
MLARLLPPPPPPAATTRPPPPPPPPSPWLHSPAPGRPPPGCRLFLAPVAPRAAASSSPRQPDSHVNVGRSSFRHCKAPKRTRSIPKVPAVGATTRATRPGGGSRGAATVHAMRDAESGGGVGDGTVQWECVFEELNPN